MLPDQACAAPDNPSDGTSPAPPAPDPSVQEQIDAGLAIKVRVLLEFSRGEHLQRKRASGTQSQGKVTASPDIHKAESHAAKALAAREEAEAIDPTHQFPAWAEDLAANKGITSWELIQWYRSYLSTP